MIRFILIFLITIFIPANVLADVVYLKNGDRLTGEVISQDAHTTTLQTNTMGTLEIQIEAIERIEGLEPQDQPAKTSVVWDNNLAVGFNRARGNTSSSELNGTLHMSRKTDLNEITVKGFAYYSERSRQMNSMRYGGSGRYAYSFGEDLQWYDFYKVEADHDRFSNIDYRITPSVGRGYWFSDTADWKLMAELGVGYTHTTHRDTAKDSDEMVVVPRVFFKKRLFKDATLSQDVIVYPSLGDLGEYRLKSETVFDNPLNEELSIRLSVIEHYNSDPKGDVKKNDLRLISSLAYKF